jgi:hypothetical protein
MKQTFEQFFIEKYVIGLIETIHIKGIGTVDAKIDSGNGGYNVIHGEEIQIQGSKVIFRTTNNKQIMKPIEEMITINVGAGNQEKRPVVEFDIQVGDRAFKDVKFSVGNRANNACKVLISKSFIEDELDALIDVSADGIADKNVEVDYGGISPSGLPVNL